MLEVPEESGQKKNPSRRGEVVDVFVQRSSVTKGNEAVLLRKGSYGGEDWLVL